LITKKKEFRSFYQKIVDYIISEIPHIRSFIGKKMKKIQKNEKNQKSTRKSRTIKGGK